MYKICFVTYHCHHVSIALAIIIRVGYESTENTINCQTVSVEPLNVLTL